jgi:large subunit ribosomal protein L13
MIVINGKDLIVGRVATFAAKKALLGETVKIVNCESMYITGNKTYLVDDAHRKRVQGTWSKGPHFFRQPDKYVRRIIRGMIPYKTSRGMAAYRRILCYVGMPDEYKSQNPITIEEASINKVPSLKYLTVSEICKHMGAKF